MAEILRSQHRPQQTVSGAATEHGLPRFLKQVGGEERKET